MCVVCVVCVCVFFVDVFQDDLRWLFRPHQVNHGDVQKPPTQVSLYKSHTTEQPLSEVVLTLLPLPPSPVCVSSSRLPIYTSTFFGVWKKNSRKTKSSQIFSTTQRDRGVIGTHIHPGKWFVSVCVRTKDLLQHLLYLSISKPYQQSCTDPRDINSWLIGRWSY